MTCPKTKVKGKQGYTCKFELAPGCGLPGCPGERNRAFRITPKPRKRDSGKYAEAIKAGKGGW